MNYFCFMEDYETETDATEMVGYSNMDTAACDYAEGWDTGDYTIARGTKAVVVTWEAGHHDKLKRFKVRAEQSLDYFANEIETPPTAEDADGK